MRPLYHALNSSLEIFIKKNATLPPHLHKYLECIYITEGTFRLGIGNEWTNLNQHDLAIIFPDVIHQFYADEHTQSQAIYLLGAQDLAGSFTGILQKYHSRTPVIRSEKIHPDIPHALTSLLCSKSDPYCFELQQAYFQVLLARILPLCELIEKKIPESSDLTWQIISYISEHFTEKISLTDLARRFGVNSSALSRIFSCVFHTNFNQYLNEIRLDYASHMLRTTDKSVTDIFMDSGFTSQTTFNRAFKAKYNLSPRDYRNQTLRAEYRLSKQSLKPMQTKGNAAESEPNAAYPLVTGRFL